MNDHEIRSLAAYAFGLASACPDPFLGFSIEAWEATFQCGSRDGYVFDSDLEAGLPTSGAVDDLRSKLSALGIEVRATLRFEQRPREMTGSPIDPNAPDHIAILDVELPPNGCGVSFSFVCERQWIELEPVSGSPDRYCNSCTKMVRRCNSIAELEDAARNNQCVSVSSDLLKSQ